MGRSVRVCLWGIRLPAASTSAVGDARCARVDATRADDLAALMGVPLEEVTARLVWSRCYAGWAGDHLASVGWVSEVDTWVGEVDSTIRPGPGEAYIWDCRTAPPFRGHGLYRDLLAQIILDLGRAGFHRAWIATLDLDGPGYRGVQRAAFRPVLRIRHIRLSSWRWWWVRRDGAAGRDDVRAARRALRQGRRPDRPVATRPSAAPPAPVVNR